MKGYSISKKRKGRRYYNFFGLFNEFSYTLLVGNIITLYLLRLNVSNSFIGLISSFSYLSFFFIIFGKKLLIKLNIVKTMGWTWLLRNIVLIPMIFSPYFVNQGRIRIAGLIIFICLLFFHIIRGIGLVGNSPLVRELSAGKDRGKFLSTYQIIVNLAVLIASITIIIFLRPETPVSIFSGFFILGILTGLIGTGLLFSIPEPVGGNEGVKDKLIDSFRVSLKSPAFRKFLVPFSFFLFISAMARPFILVYAKEIFYISDRTAMLLAIFGTLGTVIMGLMSGFFLDRIGAKPLMIVYTFITGISIIPGFLPANLVILHFFLLTSLMFFLFQFGSTGNLNSSQAYFYSMISQKEQVNLGIIYFFIMGTTGTLGSNIGGLYLDVLRYFTEGNSELVYKIFFSTILILMLTVIILMGRLENKGAHPLPRALRIMFSLKDLRAISLLNKLDNIASVEAEQKVIREIATSHSSFPEREVIKKLTAPSFAIRSEALYALSGMEITDELEEALLNQIENYHFTTASIAARICGQRGIKGAIPVLRESLKSNDYLLVSKSMFSLAELMDKTSLSNIEQLILISENPMVIIHGVSALRLFMKENSIKILFTLLSRPNLPVYIREEIFVSLTGLLNFKNWFYRFYLVYRDNHEEGIELLLDQLDRKGVSRGIDFSFISEENLGTRHFIAKSGAFLETMIIDIKVKHILKAGLKTENIARYKGVSFLVASFIVYNYTVSP